MNKTKILATKVSILALGMALSGLTVLETSHNVLYVSAESYDESVGYGDEPIDYFSDPSEEQIIRQSNSELDYSSNIVLPDSVDLSQSPYFPKIGNQMDMGSCVAWATTYYQFTYEANKLNGIVTDDDNTYSPAWTFNLWNGGADNGSVNSVAYDLLKTHGAVRMVDAMHHTGQQMILKKLIRAILIIVGVQM